MPHSKTSCFFTYAFTSLIYTFTSFSLVREGEGEGEREGEGGGIQNSRVSFACSLNAIVISNFPDDIVM